ncbi:MAG TPA: FAD-dependent oxidoreductase [Candidatus Acidoferrales bacterium]|nr:FAD-dependent oxidoreductase [Candidatus Acidoferrales bacterium]
MNQDYIVVGGGLAGLSAAIALAERKHGVRVFERSSILGGRAVTQLKEGFAMNFGPHALYTGGAADRTFRRWGIRYSGNRPDFSNEAYFVLNGQRLPFLETLAKEGISKLIMSTDADRTQGRFEDWLREKSLSDEAAELMRAMVRLTTYCTDMKCIAADAAIRQMQLAFAKGVLYLDGGWGTLVSALKEKAASLGVQLETNASVKQIEGCSVKLADGRSVSGAGIIIAVSRDAIGQLTAGTLPASMSARLALLDLGLRRVPSSSVWFALGVDSPFYFSAHSIWASLAPSGAALVHVAKCLNSRDSATRDELEQFTDSVIPGWRAEVQIARFLPNMVASGGIPTLAGRPDVDALQMERVAICGDWVGPEAMLVDAAVASALRAAKWIQSGEIGRSDSQVADALKTSLA